MLEDHVLEHELTHWFILQNAGFPGARYNAAEHIGCPGGGQPCTSPYIMKEFAPHPLKWFDDPQAGVCESFEVWSKAATWNDP